MKKAIAVAIPITILVIVIIISSVRKPYDTPAYREIKPHETAFVVPLEGDTYKQAKFASVKHLEDMKVAAKRIQITHRWNQTGRMHWQGEWIDNVMVITVDRSPVTREWSADAQTGTSTKNQAIWAESRDSIEFSTGITVTAQVAEENAALFLYRYQNKNLAYVMDNEVRARVQATFSDISAQYDMSELRGKKREILDAIRKDITVFFQERGITITTVGQFGGFTYRNPKIQDAIDSVFIAQREKDVAKAMLEAQSDKNRKLQMEGEGEAKKLREIAKGRKDAAITAAEGKSQAIRMVAEATKAAGSDPTFLRIKQLEVDKAKVEKWNGVLPVYSLTTGGGNSSFLMTLPSPDKK